MNHFVSRRSTVLVMHPDPLVCAGVVAALRQHPGFDVKVQGANTALSEASDVDVVVTDFCHAVQLAGDGDQPTRQPLTKARILALTSRDREADIRRAIAAGVHGYLLLDCALGELVDGVATVGRGARYLGKTVAQKMADSLTHPELTSRELGVLQLVAMGESNKAIARSLRIELGTVKSHMNSILNKLGASSRTQAAGIAAARGLLETVPAVDSRSMPAGEDIRSVVAPLATGMPLTDGHGVSLADAQTIRFN